MTSSWHKSSWNKRQGTIVHESDYTLSPEDELKARQGEAIFIRGRALAMAEAVCEEADNNEVMWYWVARPSEPLVIDRLVLPGAQQVTAGSCITDGQAIIRLNRRVRRMGLRIVAAGHSHGRSMVYSSVTDERMMKQLADEGVVFASEDCRSLKGKMSLAGGLRLPAVPAPSLRSNAGGFLTGTTDTGPRRVVEQADVTIEIVVRHMISIFSTHNAFGDFYFPVYHRLDCPLCGLSNDWFSDDVQLHIIGDIQVDTRTVDQLVAQVKQTVERPWFTSGYVQTVQSQWQTSTPGETSNQSNLSLAPSGDSTAEPIVSVQPPAVDSPRSGAAPAATGAAPAASTDFEVHRYGQLVGRIPAAVLEEAAYRFPKLAEALGWSDRQPSSAGTNVSVAAEADEKREGNEAGS